MPKERHRIRAEDMEVLSPTALYTWRRPFTKAIALTVLCLAGLAALTARYHHDTCGTMLQPVADRFFDGICEGHTGHRLTPAPLAEQE